MSHLSLESRTAAESAPGRACVVAVLGSTGFIGSAVSAELRVRGAEVRPVVAPRLQWPQGRCHGAGTLPAGVHPDAVDGLAQRLDGVRIVINAAGVPDGNAPASPGLYGANSLLPALVARACAAAGVERFIHLSSAAVQGRDALDETAHTAPFSPYSRSKALGERLLLQEDYPEKVIFRSTWVHDVGRANTRSLIRLAQSPLSCVAGDGTAPTPQVLVGDIAASVAHLGLARGPIPPILLQPANGMTTGLLLRLFGGREPRHLPHRVARAAVRGLSAYARVSLSANAHARRVDMLLFGKRQVPGWLAGQGVTPALRHQAWERLAVAGQAAAS
jgi:dTDP-4-dehydrorhamnose reductase